MNNIATMIFIRPISIAQLRKNGLDPSIQSSSLRLRIWLCKCRGPGTKQMCHSVHRPCGHPRTADGPVPGPVPTGRIRPPHPDSLHLRAFVIFVHRNVQLPIVGSGKMFHCERVTSRCSDSDEIPLQRSVYV
jgi:hypothetical protein